ncbi:MAG: tRNA (5-methylaminomethyl-2-thiouridine)(34)-methyltransferase MnmD [Pseudomonadota bacterium]
MADIDWADIEWDENGTPMSARFQDPYYSRTDGQAETRHVFLAGNGLPGRWQDERWLDTASFTIAELGFGTGLNFLETLAHWQQLLPNGQLNYVAFEKFPMPQADLARALARWQGLAEQAAQLIARWPPEAGWSAMEFDGALLHIAIGDANDHLETWNGKANAWYLDGFSPAQNPDMWGSNLMQAVAGHTQPGGTFATFTVAGWVRRNLQAAGFEVEKMPGFGRKRECLRGRLPR